MIILKNDLVVENDDSPNEYSVKDLIRGVHLRHWNTNYI